MKCKGIIFILDGLGDRPNCVLQGKTPLEAAKTPTMDALARTGQCGLMDPLMPGLPVDTHTGVGILFGLSPHDAAKLSRGPVEAAGINIKLTEGDILLRANFATLGMIGTTATLIDRRAGRISDGMSELCSSLQDIDLGNGIVGSLHPATQHRAVLKLSGVDLSQNVSDTDPGGQDIEEGILKSVPLDESNFKAQRTAEAINAFTEISCDVLKSHPINASREQNQLLPANCVLTRGAGIYNQVNTIVRHLGLKTAVVAGEKTILGLATLFDYSSYGNDAFTSLLNTDIEKKLSTAKEALNTHDLIYVHLKGTDIAAHDKLPLMKKEFIEKFDQALSQQSFDNVVLGIAADHSTDSISGEHNGDSVPILINHPEGRIDLSTAYNESACISGSLGRITGQQFLTSVLDAMGAMHNYKVSDYDYFMHF